MEPEQTNPEKPRGRPFEPGQSPNPAGRPRGSRNRTTLAAEQLLEGEAEELTRTVIELAKRGNVSALHMCMDRIYPVRRDRLLQVEIPLLTSVADVPEVIAAIFYGICAGELSLEEGTKLAGLVDLYVRAKLGCIRHDDAQARLIDAQDEREDKRAMEEKLPSFAKLIRKTGGSDPATP